MPCGDFKDLAKRTTSAKVLCDKAFNIAKNPKYGGYQRSLASVVYNFLRKSPKVVILNPLLKMKLNQMNN